MDTEYQDADSDMECSDNDNECFDVYDYYNVVDDNDMEQIDPSQTDPEYFAYDCLTEVEVEQLLNEGVATLSKTLQITPSLAKVSSSSKPSDLTDRYNIIFLGVIAWT